MKQPTIFKGLGQRGLIQGWLVLLFVVGGVCLLSGCGRVNELARQQLAAETELREIRLQLSELNDKISQVAKDNAAFIERRSAQDIMPPAERERTIQELELRVKKLETAKHSALKRLDEAKGLLAAQQSRRSR